MFDMDEVRNFDLGRLTLVGWLLGIGTAVAAIVVLTYVMMSVEGNGGQAPQNGGYSATESPKEPSTNSGFSKVVQKVLGFVAIALMAVLFVVARYVLEAIGLPVMRPLAVPPPPPANPPR